MKSRGSKSRHWSDHGRTFIREPRYCNIYIAWIGLALLQADYILFGRESNQFL